MRQRIHPEPNGNHRVVIPSPLVIKPRLLTSIIDIQWCSRAPVGRLLVKFSTPCAMFVKSFPKAFSSIVIKPVRTLKMHHRPGGFFLYERFAPPCQGARPVRAKAPLRHRLACAKPRHWGGVVEILVWHIVDSRILQRALLW
jgi:hypothetical protein